LCDQPKNRLGQQLSPWSQSSSVWQAVIMHSFGAHQVLLTAPDGRQHSSFGPQSSGPSQVTTKSPEHAFWLVHS